MIQNISLNYFKSWRDTHEIRLAPITALFGSNSSGKTSLMQMLLMLKQTAESSDRYQVLNLGDERSYVELGTFQEVLFGHDLTLPMQCNLQWKLPEPITIENPAHKDEILFRGSELGFSTAVRLRNDGGQKQGRAVVEQMTYSFDNHEFGMLLTNETKSEYDLFPVQGDFKFIRAGGRVWKLPPPVKCFGFPDQVQAYFQNAGFLADFELKFKELFSNLYYLGPLREYPKRQYSWAGEQPGDMGRRGERVVDALLSAQEAGRLISRGQGKKRTTLEQLVATWLKELGLIANFQVRAISPGGKLFQVWVQRNVRAAEVLITDVGFGVSQILPVITLCYYAPEGSTILLEQPEIHLHPQVQAGLADVFIDAMKTRHIQIIIESHSEHLLRRLQRRVAEEKMAPDEAAIYFCTMDKGESQLTPLEMDLFGNIQNWPKDFFGDEFGEIAAMSKATIDRKIRKKG